jgi:hypothetical protein
MAGKHRKAPAKLLRKSTDQTQQLTPVKPTAKTKSANPPKHAKD